MVGQRLEERDTIAGMNLHLRPDQRSAKCGCRRVEIDGKAVAFPRKFYVREDSIRHVPKLRIMERFAACVANPQEGRLVALDPLEFGKPWRIAPASVSTMLYIEPNHGAGTTLRRSGKVEMTRHMLLHCAPPISRRRDWLGDLCATVDQANTYVIELGDIASAVAATIGVFG